MFSFTRMIGAHVQMVKAFMRGNWKTRTAIIVFYIVTIAAVFAVLEYMRTNLQ